MARLRLKDYSTDPILLASDFRCAYFGRDLLETLETFVTFARDHVVPKCSGGSDGASNRVAACAACDTLKADARTKSIEHARQVVQLRRDRTATAHKKLCAAFRRDGE